VGLGAEGKDEKGFAKYSFLNYWLKKGKSIGRKTWEEGEPRNN